MLANEPKELARKNIYQFNPNYSVILGCPRSGTTFLIDSLEALPNSECISGHIFPLMLSHLLNTNISGSIQENLSNLFEFSIQDYLESIQNNRTKQVHKFIKRTSGLKELIQTLKGQRKIESVIYKEPFLAFSPEFTFNALPNCKIIHIYRDGRDCADSLERRYQVLNDEKLTTLQTAEMPIGRKFDHRYVPWWVQEGREEEFLSYSPFLRSVWMWSVMVNRCRTFFSKPDIASKNRVLEIKYEDLVLDPLTHMEKICSFLGSRSNSQLEMAFKKASIKSIGIHDYREREEIDLANAIAETELKYFGYL